MKIKLKTLSKQKQETILENSNFLNNQNYVLGKNEKKKILSKFFVENNILFFLNLFNNIKIIFSKKINLWKKVFIVLYSFLAVFAYLIFTNANIIFIFLSFFIPFPIIFILKYLELRNTKYQKNLVEISSFKNLFTRRKHNIFWTFIFMSIYISPPLVIFFQLLVWNEMISLYVWIFFILSLIFKKSIKNFLKLKFLFILFFPILIILEIFIWTYFYIKFIFTWTKWFKITKFSYKKNLINKFLLLNKNYWENMFYKIEQKK